MALLVKNLGKVCSLQLAYNSFGKDEKGEFFDSEHFFIVTIVSNLRRQFCGMISKNEYEFHK